jgi:hypothetical protein
MRKIFEFGGFIAGAVLIIFGVAVIALGASGRSTVQTSLSQEKIVGSEDMTPALIKTAADEAGLVNVSLPSCDVANKAIDTGSEARCFAQYMRIHALESSGGLTYAEMGRFATADGAPKGTNDATAALMVDDKPVANAARNTWITETSLATALNMGYMAEQLALFSIVIGIALLLTGIGFVVLDWVALHRRREAEDAKTGAVPATTPTKPVTV